MTVAAAVPMRSRLPLSQLLTLSIYWLGILTIWGGLDSVVIPQRLLDLDRGSAGSLQAVIAVVGVVAPILIQPTVGVISDFTMTRWGRRLESPAWDRPRLRAHFLRTLALPGVRRMIDEQGLDLPDWAGMA